MRTECVPEVWGTAYQFGAICEGASSSLSAEDGLGYDSPAPRHR